MNGFKQNVMTLVMAGTGMVGPARALHLTPDMIVQAWKSESYRATLSAEQLSQLPQNPAGENSFTMALQGQLLAMEDVMKGTCDHGCPCTTYQSNCSGTAASDCSNTAASDCSNTAASDCCNTSCANC